MQLNPTLWRTCRALAGETRIQLFRQLYASPGLCVSQLADEVGIGCSCASQELRRLQSRGLLQVARVGPYVRYRPGADPQVADAHPILVAMERVLTRRPASRDEEILCIASALAHPRRMAILRNLLAEPQDTTSLQTTLKIPLRTLHHHLEFLLAGNMIRLEQGVYSPVRNRHPLAKCLIELVRKSGAG